MSEVLWAGVNSTLPVLPVSFVVTSIQVSLAMLMEAVSQIWVGKTHFLISTP